MAVKLLSDSLSVNSRQFTCRGPQSSSTEWVLDDGFYMSLKVSQNRSWIFGDSVISNGELECIFKVDPLFFIISILADKSAMEDISDIFFEEAGFSIDYNFDLERICTIKKIDEHVLVKLDSTKVCSFLDSKLEMLIAQYEALELFQTVEKSYAKQKTKSELSKSSVCLLILEHFVPNTIFDIYCACNKVVFKTGKEMTSDVLRSMDSVKNSVYKGGNAHPNENYFEEPQSTAKKLKTSVSKKLEKAASAPGQTNLFSFLKQKK